eukprot:GAHX01000880.1.p1 GENE.GAHX01000880.1~~GAHX01000880.1.p1  ORF type:complete len:679 (+),score=141.83 GAHX01000880.1:66-2102(+)
MFSLTRKSCCSCDKKVFRRRTCKNCERKFCKNCYKKYKSKNFNHNKTFYLCNKCSEIYNFKAHSDVIVNEVSVSESVDTLGHNEQKFTESSQGDHLSNISQNASNSDITLSNIAPIKAIKPNSSIKGFKETTKHNNTQQLENDIIEDIKEENDWDIPPNKKSDFKEEEHHTSLSLSKFLPFGKSKKTKEKTHIENNIVENKHEFKEVETNVSHCSIQTLPSFKETIPLSLTGVKKVVYGHLMLKIHSASDVPVCDSVLYGGKADPYVFIGIAASKHEKSQILCRTSVRKKTLEPSWEESFCIPVHDFQHPQLLKLTLMDKDEITKDEKIGTFYLDLKKIPFNTMINSQTLKIEEVMIRHKTSKHNNVKLKNDNEDEFEQSTQNVNNTSSKNNKNSKNKRNRDDSISEHFTTLKISYEFKVNYKNALLSNLIPYEYTEIELHEKFDAYLVYSRLNTLLDKVDPILKALQKVSELMEWTDIYKSLSFVIFVLFVLLFTKVSIIVVLLFIIFFMLRNLFNKFIRNQSIEIMKYKYSGDVKLMKKLKKGRFNIFKKLNINGESSKVKKQLKPFLKLLTLPTSIISSVKTPLHNLQLSLRFKLENFEMVRRILMFEDSSSPLLLTGLIALVFIVYAEKLVNTIKVGIFVICINKSGVLTRVTSFVKGLSSLISMHLYQMKYNK